jgi:hypothetical protein
MDTQTQIDRLIELAIIQRSELKQLVEQLPELREHLNNEIQSIFEQTEPEIRQELETFFEKQTTELGLKLSASLEAKVAALASDLNRSTQARYNVLKEQEQKLETLRSNAKENLANEVAGLPEKVKDLVEQQLAKFPIAGEIEQLRREFAEPKTITPRGRWEAGMTYNKLELVSYAGESYISNGDGNQEKPSRSSSRWTLVAARGGHSFSQGGNAGGGASVAVVSVQDDAARYALTATQAPVGTIVRVASTSQDYLVIDTSALGTDLGYSNLNPAGPAQIILRRGNTSELAAITPAEAEPVYDTEKKFLRMGDGATLAGNIPPAAELVGADGRPCAVSVTTASDRGLCIAADGAGVGVPTYGANKITYSENGPDASPYVFFDSSGGAAFLYPPSSGGIIEIPATGFRYVEQNDVSKSNTTFLSISAASLPGNVAFSFDALLYFTADASGGVKVSVTSSSGADILGLFYKVEARKGDGNLEVFNIRTSLTVDANTGHTNYVFDIRGGFYTDNATDFGISFAKNAAAGGNTTLKSGSYIRLFRAA